MPLKLKDPRPGKTPYYSIRGTYRGIQVDRSCKTDRRSVALAELKSLQRKIERGEWPPPAPVDRSGEPTFIDAANAYMRAGGERRYVSPLITYFGGTFIADIGQTEVDAAAAAMHPSLGPASRNRYVYSPVQAILRHAGAGVTLSLKRPKGAAGRVVTAHLTPEDAAALIRAAASYDREFALLLIFLLYTGTRLGEALALTWDDVRPTEALAFVRTSKNGEPRTLRLRRDLCDMLAEHAGTNSAREHVFRFRYGGRLYLLLRRATLAVSGAVMPPRPKKGQSHRFPRHRLSWVNFHTFRHTWATFMRRYGGIDLQGLVATGNWRHARSAARYAHVAAHEEWDRVERLPAIKLDAG